MNLCMQRVQQHFHASLYLVASQYIVGSLRDREVACTAIDRKGSNFESCVWRTVSSQSSHHSQEVLLAQFSQYLHKCDLKPDSFHYLRMKSCKNVQAKYMYRTTKTGDSTKGLYQVVTVYLAGQFYWS